jgi:hypothetical protein
MITVIQKKKDGWNDRLIAFAVIASAMVFSCLWLHDAEASHRLRRPPAATLFRLSGARHPEFDPRQGKGVREWGMQ